MENLPLTSLYGKSTLGKSMAGEFALYKASLSELIREYIETEKDVSISKVKIAHLYSTSEEDIVVATTEGILFILSFKEEKEGNEAIRLREVFDLSENGSIWHIEIADLNGDGKDELIIGGTVGTVIALDGKGKELWRTYCSSAVTTIQIWNNFDYEKLTPKLKEYLLKNEKGEAKLSSAIIITSLDKSVRVLSPNGKLIWGQLLSDGVSAIDRKDGLCVISANNGEVRAFDENNGELLWVKQFETNIRAIKIMEEGVLLGGDERKVRILSKTTGEVKREKGLESYVWFIVKCLLEETRNRIIVSTYSFKYLGMEEEKEPEVNCMELPSLKTMWKLNDINCQDLEIIRGTPYLLAATTSGELRVIDTRNGKTQNLSKWDTILNSLSHYVLNVEKSVKKKKVLIVYGGDCKDLGLVVLYLSSE